MNPVCGAAVMRGAKKIDLKKIADKALEICAKEGFKVKESFRSKEDPLRYRTCGNSLAAALKVTDQSALCI